MNTLRHNFECRLRAMPPDQRLADKAVGMCPYELAGVCSKGLAHLLDPVLTNIIDVTPRYWEEWTPRQLLDLIAEVDDAEDRPLDFLVEP